MGLGSLGNRIAKKISLILIKTIIIVVIPHNNWVRIVDIIFNPKGRDGGREMGGGSGRGGGGGGGSERVPSSGLAMGSLIKLNTQIRVKIRIAADEGR